MNSVFMGGIPTSGKSYLAKKLSKVTGATHVCIDDLRIEMRKDPKLEPWVNFFWNKTEEKYWEEVSCEDHWINLKNQSEAFWLTVENKINDFLTKSKPAIFEGVNLLPSLMVKLPVRGVFLLGKSEGVVFERIKKKPRWGKTEELQKKEAEFFFRCERSRYEENAKKYYFKTFSRLEEAEKELLILMDYKE